MPTYLHAVVVLDANVLIRFGERDLFLRLVEHDALRVHWTREILDEMERNLVASRIVKTKGPNSAEDTARQLRQLLEDVFEDAEVVNYQRHLPAMKNNAKDRHVAAAAVEAEADYIVTHDTRDFVPPPSGVRVDEPDSILAGLAQDAWWVVETVLQECVDQLRKPGFESVEAYVDYVERDLPAFAKIVRRRLAGH